MTRNRLATVTDAQGSLTRYTYDAVGNRQATAHANGTVASYQYDTLNRLTQLQLQTAAPCLIPLAISLVSEY